MSFSAYLSDRGLSVNEDLNVLELLADDFLSNDVKFCVTPPPEVLEKARYIIAYAHSSNGGGFSAKGVSNGLIIKKRKVDVLEQEFHISDESLVGNDYSSKLKQLGAYDMLSEYLCDTNVGIGVYVI